MSLPRYKGYKDSGDLILGQIPEHWAFCPLKAVVDSDNSGCYGVEPEGAEIQLPVATTAQIDSRGQFDVANMPMRGFTEAEVRRYGCSAGDILVVKSSGSATNIISGKSGIVDKATEKFVFSNFLLRIKPHAEDVLPSYLYRVISSSLTRERVQLMCSSTTYPNLKVGEYISATIPLPPIAEQTTIATFLDRETGKIDALIAEQEMLLALLAEKRQATISHAVTKGLNPDAPMKESGVAWLGKVPEHWEILKGARIGTLFGSGPVAEDEVHEEGSVPFIKVGSLSAEGFEIANWNWHVSEATAGRLNPYSEFVVFPKRGAAIFLNKVNIVKCRALIDPNLMGWKIRQSISSAYVAYLLTVRKLQELADVSTVPQINNKHIEPEKFPIPPLSEQEAIVEFVSTGCQKIDALKAESERAIALLKERRSALIAAAVTGQIDVRGLVTEPEAA